MDKMRFWLKASWVMSAAIGADTAHAQWRAEGHALEAGWNSVFLLTDPAKPQADGLFTGLPIEAVWTPADPRTIRPPNCEGADANDPNCADLPNDRWWVWVPPNSPQALGQESRDCRQTGNKRGIEVEDLS